ncbi:preprotein translocase subunit YajC [Actinokineospora sp. NBRC 105648]|uniref:preprotein translocase subunit YajC n=1 Tax=Actinokineospora sp. NBRC 105648 TaxID=3032206 RepID=UPI0024A2BD94|nr:preprotein translocase subunit YajC [Actinokineospora sp. NBRC 105648]GLZ43027.1 preprotein translocase subunit YajC [Actinokineospora sp. NBRC 105648]
MNSALLPLLLVAVLAIPLILGSRKQKRLLAQQQELQNALTVGDRVMTTSGMYGTVSDVSDDATIGIELAPGVETVWLRQAIREKVGPDVVDEDDDELTAGDHESIPAESDSAAEVAPPLEHRKPN